MCACVKDFSKFNLLKPKLLETVDKMLAEDIARLMHLIPLDDESNGELANIRGGAFKTDSETPFSVGKFEGIDEGSGDVEWIVSKTRYKYDEIFESLGPINGKITGAVAKPELIKSKLPNSILSKVWKLADLDQDGMLDVDEFAVAMYLINLKLEGNELPNELPIHLIPPSKINKD